MKYVDEFLFIFFFPFIQIEKKTLSHADRVLKINRNLSSIIIFHNNLALLYIFYCLNLFYTKKLMLTNNVFFLYSMKKKKT